MIRRLLIVLILCSPAFPATLYRIACGSLGGVDLAGNVWAPDANFSGGATWVNTPGTALTSPYRNLRYSNPPGQPFAYTIPLPPGAYSVTLKFIEPNKTVVGQRIFSVALNGATAVNNLDLVASAGVLTPYDLTFPVTVASTGQLRIALAAVTGNAVISGIQIDSVPPPPPTSAESVCENGMGTFTGWGTLMPGVWQLRGCENMTSPPRARTVVRARCRADKAGAVLDVMAPDTTGQLQSLLAAPIPCTEDGTEGAGNGSLPAGADLHWMIRVNDSQDPAVGTSTFVTAAVVFNQF